MFSALMQWLLHIFKHVVVLLSNTCSWWYIYIFLTQLLNAPRPTILFSDFVHAECITQHCVHVATLLYVHPPHLWPDGSIGWLHQDCKASSDHDATSLCSQSSFPYPLSSV
jgi:hypothetical protein